MMMDAHRIKTLRHYLSQYSSHTWLIVLSVFGLILSVLEILMISPGSGIFWLIFVPYITMIFLLPVLTRYGCWAILFFALLAPLIEGPNQPLILSGEIIAIGVLAYYSSLQVSLAALAVCIAIHTVAEAVSHQWEPVPWVAVAALYAAGLLSGIVFSQHRRKLDAQRISMEQKITEERLKNMQDRKALAIRIHDSVTNNLSGISLIAHSHSGAGATDSISEADAQDWKLVADHSSQAFAQIHEILDLLDDDTYTRDTGLSDKPGNRQPAAAGLLPELHSFVSRERSRLENLKFTGTVKMNGTSTYFSDAAHAEILSVITEIFANIQRHAPQGRDSYALAIVGDADGITIRETNDIKDTDPLPGAEASGRGLRMHKEAIEALGGTLRMRTEDNQWMIYVYVPGSYSPALS